MLAIFFSFCCLLVEHYLINSLWFKSMQLCMRCCSKIAAHFESKILLSGYLQLPLAYWTWIVLDSKYSATRDIVVSVPLPPPNQSSNQSDPPMCKLSVSFEMLFVLNENPSIGFYHPMCLFLLYSRSRLLTQTTLSLLTSRLAPQQVSSSWERKQRWAFRHPPVQTQPLLNIRYLPTLMLLPELNFMT